MENKPRYSSIISGRAQKEIIASFDWYDERQKGLGDRFVEEVMLKIHKIEQNPELYSLKYKSYRETLVAVFPILIIFRINKKEKIIRIVSVFHTSRNYREKYQS